MEESRRNRREFLEGTMKGAVVAGLGAGLIGNAAAGASEAGERREGIPQRSFGKSGEKVAAICLGGYHIGTIREEKEAIRVIQSAVDRGMTFLDNAWEYHQGRSEELMGKALAGGRRDKVFLMTKHHGRDAKMAREHLEDSLRRLRTDVLDLWQFHEIVYKDDPEWIHTRGALEVARKAKEEGKVRYIGFTGHKDPRIFLDMLGREFEWDAVQMPLNVLDAHFRSFEHQVLPIARYRGMGVVGMKPMASGAIVREKIASPEECLRYALSLPVSTVTTGCESMERVDQALRVAREFQPFSEEDKTALLARTRSYAMTGKYELFKTSRRFDGPVGRRLHGVG